MRPQGAGATVSGMMPRCMRTDDSMVPLTTSGRVNLHLAAAWRVDEINGMPILRVTWPSMAVTEYTLIDD